MRDRSTQIKSHEGNLQPCQYYPLTTEELLHLLGEDGIGVVGLGVVLELLGVEEHLQRFAMILTHAKDRHSCGHGASFRVTILHR